MKLNISDMMDHVENIPVDLNEKDIASAERIKEATMKKIHQANPNTPIVKKWGALAACLALVVVVGATAAFASGRFGGLDSYFGGNADIYLDEILSAVTAVSNDEMELRADGAIADERSCHMVVSFVGLTEEVKERFAAGDLAEQQKFDLYAITSTGERIEFQTKASDTYTADKASGGRKAQTMFADADMTYLLTGFLGANVTMNDIDKVCFAFEGLTLEVDIQNYIAPEVELVPEVPSEDSLTEFHVSRLGFYYTGPLPDGEIKPFEMKLIRSDGTIWEDCADELGWRSDTTYLGDDDSMTVSCVGYWGGGSHVAVGLIDLADFCGVQINGQNYYFVTEQ